MVPAPPVPLKVLDISGKRASVGQFLPKKEFVNNNSRKLQGASFRDKGPLNGPKPYTHPLCCNWASKAQAQTLNPLPSVGTGWSAPGLQAMSSAVGMNCRVLHSLEHPRQKPCRKKTHAYQNNDLTLSLV